MLDENRENIKTATTELANASPKINRTIDSLYKVTESLNKGEGTLGKLLTEDELYTDFSEIAANLRDTSDKIAQG